MEKIKKAVFLSIPMSICNFRCSYCYLSHRDKKYQGKQITWPLSPEDFRRAFSKKRIGGIAYFNFCADGETLLVRDIEKYVEAILKEGHYVEFITNLSISSVLDKFLTFDKALLRHIEFKCSFHYVQLKEKGLLDVFASNVQKIWESGASACIEITPSDDQICYIEEIKKFSIEKFGALPHITIARDDKTRKIDFLTSLDINTYKEIWSTFNSEFWNYKMSIFKKKQRSFCYAGKWSIYVNVETGDAKQCYCGRSIGNVFNDIDKPFPELPIGRCSLPHCYNGHAFLTLGLIPDNCSKGYGDIRDRTKNDGSNWLQKEYKEFINGKLFETNKLLTKKEKYGALIKTYAFWIRLFPGKVIRYFFKKRK